MRQKQRLKLLCGAALLAFASVSAASPSLAQESKPAVEKTKPFDDSIVGSFSGAFLAARTADVDGDLDTAIKLYKLALGFEPDNVDVKQRLMITQLMNGHFEEGAALAETLKSDPSVERITTIVRAIDAIRTKQFTSAGKILNYTGPNDLDRLMNGLLQAWAKMGEGKEKEALALIKGMEGPEWFDLFKNYNGGAIALATGDRATARTLLNEAVTNRDGGSAAPDTFMRAVVALARLEATDGNKQKALDAISVGDNMVSNYSPLKALRQSIEKGEKQEQQVRDATQGAAGVLFSIGGALNREGAEDIVSLYLQSARALDPASADTLVMLGGLAETTKKPEKAIALYRSVPENSPMRRISELQLGLALAATGKTDESKKHLNALIAADPSDIRSYIALGSVLSEAKDYKAMGDIYDRAIEAIGPLPNKSNWTVFFQRGIAYERQKKWDIAEPSFRKALELNPEQPQVLNYLGYSWVDMNINLDEGMDMIRRAVELKPDDGYIVDSLGWAYYRLGKFSDAVTELEKAAELKAGDPTINDHLGDAYWQVGRKLEAGFQWKRALGLKPELPEITKINEKIKNGLPTSTVQVADNKADPAKQTDATGKVRGSAPLEETPVAKRDPAGTQDDSTGSQAETKTETETQAETKTPATSEQKPVETQTSADKPVPAETTGAAATEETPAQQDAVVKQDAVAAEIMHTVAKGDSLWEIAKQSLGNGERLTDILSLNPTLVKNPNLIFPGQIIKLPSAKP